MQTINHEYYVSLEVAKLLKEAGFDWKCNHYYLTQNGNTEAKSDFRHPAQNYNEPMATMDSKSFEFEVCSCPTLEVAQRWLREVKELLLGMAIHDNALNYAWEYTISRINHVNLDGRDLSLIDWLCDNYDETENIIHHGKKFIPYEETLESGIKKALEIILDKVE